MGGYTGNLLIGKLDKKMLLPFLGYHVYRENDAPCPCDYNHTAAEPIGWTWDHVYRQNAAPGPCAYNHTAAELVGWTWDHVYRQNAAPCPCAYNHTAAEPVGWTWAHVYRQNTAPCPCSCNHYSYCTSWIMDMGIFTDKHTHIIPDFSNSERPET
ncbi:hypothetical protein AVEN_69462-1 [Araneus ventricosus]|uniref:Uncharacterized protein n=1 Tax=Araneus ventricosus TaxID=182803 RepID=A0A4Y2W6N6_ARAVE|nr:hypothetical protein AVEN_69462-1 [Araneus ventricosus]